MEHFWQLSGPESHISRSWKHPRNGNVTIASQFFKALVGKLEGSTSGIDFILGIETSGASHILIPYSLRNTIHGLGLVDWRRDRPQPYPGSKFASLSPIHVDTELKLQNLLEDRQKVAKATESAKNRGDNSKVNGRFWEGRPNPSRAAFEHSRLLWRILRGELRPQCYSLADAPWKRSVNIFSIALNFWAPGGKFTEALIDASLTQASLESIRTQDRTADKTWYFEAEEQQGLLNATSAQERPIPKTWFSSIIPQVEIAVRIKNILATHSRPRDDPPAPLILLVHDHSTVKDRLETLGIHTSGWKYELKELLGFNMLNRDRQHQRKEEKFDTTQGLTSDPRRPTPPRARSRSPLAQGSTLASRLRSPSPARSYAPVYIVDTVDMFKTVTGSGEDPRRIRPSAAWNKLTCRHETDPGRAGDDSIYIMQSWKTMTHGLSIDEQGAFYEDHACSEASWPAPQVASSSALAEAPDDQGLFRVQQDHGHDMFNDGTDSEDEYY